MAASHLDTVLEKLKDILDNVGQNIIQRFACFQSLLLSFDLNLRFGVRKCWHGIYAEK